MASYEEGADADWGGKGWCWDGFHRSNQIITLTDKYNMYIVHIVWRKNNIHIARCRLVGETDSEGRATGEGSLTYTNGDRFEVIVFSFSSLV